MHNPPIPENEMDRIDTILSGKAQSTDGTGGEQGYGFGLALVKHLVDTLKGTMRIYSHPGKRG